MSFEAYPITENTPELRAALGSLMPHLDPSFPSGPVPQERLQRYIEAPDRDVLILENTALSAAHGRLVLAGTATMDTIGGIGHPDEGYLEDFIVDETCRGTGAAETLWRAMGAWCIGHNYDRFSLNTEEWRPAAIRFYERMGATAVSGAPTHFVMEVAASDQRR